MQYRADIQGIRAIAVIFVFIFHLFPSFFSGGFIGVDIFFVISGYLISAIILHQKVKNQFSIKIFFISRIKRLLPVYYFFILAILLGGVFLFIPHDMKILSEGVGQSLIFNSNNYLSRLDDYFGVSSTENPILHTWTLSIEMQFYLLWPFFWYFLLKIKKKWINFILICSILVLLSYSFYQIEFKNAKNEMYFSFFSRIPEFLLGAVLALNFSEIRAKIKDNFSEFLSIFCIVVIFFSGYFFNEKINFPGFWVLLPCLATFFLILTLNSKVNIFLSNRVFVHIGELSYSIYLWHWGVIAFYRYYLNDYNYVFSFYEFIFIALIVYVLSFLSYAYVETPFRKLKNIGFSLKFSGLILVLFFVFFSAESWNKKMIKLPLEYVAPVVGMDSHADFFKKVEVFGFTKAKDEKILLIGDSHALVYKNFLDKVGKKYKFNFRTITNSGYPNIPYTPRSFFQTEKKWKMYQNVIEKTKQEIQKSKVIIIASAYWKGNYSLQGFERFLMENKDKKIVFLNSFPFLDLNPIKLNKSHIKNPNKKNHYKIFYSKIPDEILKISQKHPKVYFLNIDYKNWNQPDLPFHKNISMYYDARHLNVYGTNLLVEDFGEDIFSQLQEILQQ